MIQIYHNSRCGKSRQCLLTLQNLEKEIQIINYLEEIPTAMELTIIIKKLNIKPIELIRKKEKVWIDNYSFKDLSDTEIINIMVQNPILIERPIVINDTTAIIARSEESINQILNDY